jgi:colanic acid/amylovoran biosynthesis glycosyltransferase
VLTVAYLANQFPSALEPYVMEEIAELRRRGVRVITGSVRKPSAEQSPYMRDFMPELVVLRPFCIFLLPRALWLCIVRWRQISDLVWQIVFQGRESPVQRAKALLHTWLGGCYAVLLADRHVEHLHVHHGYFGSWIAMIASRLLGVGFSMTLHGSDLLVHAAHLDAKLQACRFCLTISNYNRDYILTHYPRVDADKVIVSRLGVDAPECTGHAFAGLGAPASELNLLAVGRLHAVKDHAFLLRACAQLHARGLRFECSIAGEGPERRKLESLICKYGLEEKVTLLGHVRREQMDSLYQRADVVVLTSRSEGVPLTLMEAMAHGRIVLAPAITGIPELVLSGKTGFLYAPGSMGDFVARLLLIHSLLRAQETSHPPLPSAEKQLDWVRHGARVQVHHNFDRKKNLASFTDLLIRRAALQGGSLPDEDLVLQ